MPLLEKTSSEGAKSYARGKAKIRFDHLNAHLEGRAYLLDSFSVADAYLLTVLNWSRTASIDLSQWPAVLAYFKRMHGRPSIAKAFSEELALFNAEQARQNAEPVRQAAAS